MIVTMPTGTTQDFGAYLRARRARLSPPAPAGGRSRAGARRQVPGLRRQEVAEAASLSVEYYTRLEQGRAPRPSRQVLGALADAFGLARAERDHVFRLAGELPPEPQSPGSEVRPGLLRLLGGLDATVPVTVHDGRLDVLARNAAAAELMGPVAGGGTYGRSIVQHGFSRGASDVLGERGALEYARWATAELRSAMARYPDDAYLRGLLAHLTASSLPFRDAWARGEVAGARSGEKTLVHPTRGRLTFQSEVLHDDVNDHWVVVYAPLG